LPFIAFDPHTGKSNPEVDVVALVDLALGNSGTGTVGAEELHEASGWPLRRFNPPFAYMVSQIDDQRVLQGGTDDYPARGFLMTDSDRRLSPVQDSCAPSARMQRPLQLRPL
jgi:hypothetical protein